MRNKKPLPHKTRYSVALDHHIYDQLSDTWINKGSKPQPYISLTAKVALEDYNALGFRQPADTNTVAISAMADTGCQSCLTGIRIVKRLGLHEKDLIPVKMKMHAANNKGICILGATFLCLLGKDQHGQTIETRQMTYVTDNSKKFFLSREACITLGIIPKDFPEVSTTCNTIQVPKPCESYDPTYDQNNDVSNRDCNCPARQKPPPPPINLPFPAIGTNRAKVQEYLLDYYKSSTFNTCEHQTLPLMEGPPMKLMVDPDATPTAHHTPVPVPLARSSQGRTGP